LLFLSADKGYSRLQDLCNRPRPRLTRHGHGFSLMVNYHAIGQYAEKLGGTWLTAPHHHTSININGFLFGTTDQPFDQTQQAYAEYIIHGGPDDFFALKKAIEPHYEAFTVPQLLAYLRRSHWDFNIFLGCFPALMEQLNDAPETLRPDVYQAVQQVWANYFPIQEKRDLAFLLGMVLYGIDYFPEALEYLQKSRDLYGNDPSMLYNMAMCHYRLRQLEPALDFIQQTLAVDPGFESAKVKRIQWEMELRQRS
ncbi:MAG: tetratricopeptide repeat protein, partial [Leptolyngbyaceae cyanobacterium]